MATLSSMLFTSATAMAMSCAAATNGLPSAGWGITYGVSRNGTANSSPGQYEARSMTATVISLRQTSDVEPESIWLKPVEDIRAELKATVSQVAVALHVSRQSVHGWMRGTKTPSAEHQERLQELKAAASQLREAFGSKLELHLSYPLGPNGEAFWELVADSTSPLDAANRLIEAIRLSDRRKAALATAIDEGLAERALEW